MILKALTLENFKGIREPVRIEFAPLTLLFGPNNAGKSTIVQALMYAREVLERNNCDAGRTELGGDIVDLGGFKNLVHAHDYRNRSMRMRFDLDLRGIGLPDYTEQIRENELDGRLFSKDCPALPTTSPDRELSEKDIWVEFEVAWAQDLGQAYVRSYRVGTADVPYAAVDCDPATGRVEISYLNGGVAPFGTRDIYDVCETSEPKDEAASVHSDVTATRKATRRDVIWKSSGWFLVLLKSLVKARMIPLQQYECDTEYVGDVERARRLPSQLFATGYYEDGPGPMPLLAADRGKTTALPKWGSRIRVSKEAWEDYDVFESDWNWGDDSYFAQEYLSDVLTTLITGPGERLIEALRESAYLSPFREVPSRQYTPVHSPGSNRWANGLAAWDWLMLGPLRTLRETNHWLGKTSLDTGYRIEVPRYRELESTGALMGALNKDQPPSWPDWDWIRAEVEKLDERIRLQIRHLRTNTILFPQDLGVGVSQVIPVIVAAVHHESGFVAIEEPESNIHPAFQVVLADLFITQAKAKPNVLFLVETHSEHLMLRCLRRIRETGKGILPEGLPAVVPEDVAVHFVEPTKDGPRIKRIEIDEDGDFIDEWPDGFFEESFRERFAGR